jgi:hypothetical protein
LPDSVKIFDISPNCLFIDGRIEFKDKTIKAFEVKTVKFTMKVPKSNEADSFLFNPKIIFTDELGQTKTCSPKPVTVSIQRQTKSLASPTVVNSETGAEIDILKKFGLSRS